MFGGKQADELGSTLTPRPVLYKKYGGQSTPETEGMSSQENSDIKTKQNKEKPKHCCQDTERQKESFPNRLIA